MMNALMITWISLHQSNKLGFGNFTVNKGEPDVTWLHLEVSLCGHQSRVSAHTESKKGGS